MASIGGNTLSSTRSQWRPEQDAFHFGIIVARYGGAQRPRAERPGQVSFGVLRRRGRVRSSEIGMRRPAPRKRASSSTMSTHLNALKGAKGGTGHG